MGKLEIQKRSSMKKKKKKEKVTFFSTFRDVCHSLGRGVLKGYEKDGDWHGVLARGSAPLLWWFP